MKNILGRILPATAMKRIAPDWEPKPRVAVVRLSGVIGASQPLRGGINLAGIEETLESAFTMNHAKAVALVINSPGGSPVQSSLIFKRIRALAAENELPVYVFAEDVAASGGYMLACAGDEIYADDSSIIGSIGVISAGFGFTGVMEKLGVERRVHTAGENKGMLDPFQPEDPEDVKRLLALQAEVHESFKALVRGARGDRLKGGDELFTGEFWAASGALARGLIDGLGDLRSVMRAKFGEDVQLKKIGSRKPWWRRAGLGARAELPNTLLGRDFSLNLAEGLISAIEKRSIWQRFGL
ncbi:MAG: S49 family peptidase [Rhizobiales bacterium]|nr:S49 family peptidase [Hyphomicrobiales bacterium]